MSMTLTLYNTASDNAAVTKVLTPVVTLPVIKPTEGIDLDAPALTVQYTPAAISCNYALLTITQGSVTEYTAYYFVKQRDIFPAEKIVLHCEIDVLQTYAAGIRSCNANVIRSQSEGISYVKDDKLPVNPSQFVLKVKTLREGVFPNTVPRQAHYILSVNTAISEG